MQDVGDVPMKDPLAYFLTWATYGTWLPGDDRGWVEYRNEWQLPARNLERICRTKMAEHQCLLSRVQRELVVGQVEETCAHRGWQLYAVDCRSNHAHVVVGAPETASKKVRADLKAWCTRRLKQQSDRENFWAERGSVRWVWDEQSLDTVVQYVSEAQDRNDRSEPEV